MGFLSLIRNPNPPCLRARGFFILRLMSYTYEKDVIPAPEPESTTFEAEVT